MNLTMGFLLSYLVGSFPTAYVVGKIVRGIDIRKHGSGNVGATNVFRVVGKKWGIGVLLFDMLKGFAAASWLPRYFSTDLFSPFTAALIFGLLAITGHTWTIWLRFHGGKGVATSAGVFFALTPQATVTALIFWFILFFWKRYVSLASLGTALSLPLWVWLFYKPTERFWILFPISLGLSVFIFYTHRENIRRLRGGTEKRLF